MKRALASFVFLTAGCLAFAALPSDPVPTGVANKTLLYINGAYYQPFSSTLPAGTKVYMDAESSLLRATQRSLGYREVDYKKQFFGSLLFTAVTPETDASNNTVYNYGTLSTSSTLAGYWTKKNLPIVLGIDGNGYITDGHHTTAGYLATAGSPLIADKNHIVLGTTVANPSPGTAVGDQMWTAFSQGNNAYLYGTFGNQLAQPGDAGYAGLQPIMPSVTVMPTTPGTSSMANDLYRSLAWGAVDAIVQTATSVTGAKIAGFSKVDSTSSLSKKPDVNFVEFFWADFLRNRVVWNDNAAVTSANLINAPVEFFAATANAIAMAKSELYKDQFGRSLTDYTGPQYSQNTQTWAKASLLNGLAVPGDTYNMFLTDDVTIQGDLIASGVAGVVSNLNINTNSGTTINGALQNFSSIAVNTGGTMTINWKDDAVNGITQNKLLEIPAGAGDVTFAGNNDFGKLSSLAVGSGVLTIDSSNSVADQTIWGVISGAGSLRKTGREMLTLSGANTISGGVYLDEGILVLASSSVTDGSTIFSSPIGTGALRVKDGTTLAFDESVRLLNSINVESASGSVGVRIHVGDNSVELAGALSASGSLMITGQPTSVMTFSGSSDVSGDVTVEAVTLRLSNATGISPRSFTLAAGGAIQAGSDTTLSSKIILLDEGKLDAGESVLEVTGVISGDGRLMLAGQPFGTVRLAGVNTYTGGTEIVGGGNVVFTKDANLGDSTGPVTFTRGGLLYSGTQDLTLARSLIVSGAGLLDMGSRTITVSAGISGTGVLEVGQYGSTGTLVVGGSSASFAGSLVISGGSLSVSHADALKGATVNVSSSGGALKFTTSEANIGGLSGDGSVALPANFKLTIGATGKSSTYVGTISGTGGTLTKAGSGKFTLGGTADVASAAVTSGELALGVTGAFSSAVKLSISKGAILSVFGTHNLVSNFNLANLDSIAQGVAIIFDGATGSELRLPKAIADKVSLLNLGSGRILTVSATGVEALAQLKMAAGMEFSLSRALGSTQVDDGVKINLDTTSGEVDIKNFSGLIGGGSSSFIVLSSGGVLNYSTTLTGFSGTLLTEGTISVSSSAGTQTALLPVKGSGSISVVAGGSVKFVSSPDYTGTASLGTGAVAELTGSLNKAATISLSASSVVNVNPAGTSTLVLPSLSGTSGLVSLNSGSVKLAGSSATFGGTLVVEKGVSFTVTADLPAGTVNLKDPTKPMGVDTSAGNISLSGTVSGDGVLALSGSGKVTMGAAASIQTSELRIGSTAADRTVLDVSQLPSGLVLAGSQSLMGGGTIVGSVRTAGAFKPGNSPGLFTVAKTTGVLSGGNLSLDSTSVTQIEYGVRADNGQYEWDKVVVGGALTIATGARIVVTPYTGTDSRGVTFIAGVMPPSITFTNVFSATTLAIGSVLPELSNPGYLYTTTLVPSGTTLGILVEKANYGQKVSTQRLQNLGYYLSSASFASPTTSFASLINVIDTSTSQAQLEAALKSVSSTVYSEAQRLSLRRTAAIDETIQRRLNPQGAAGVDGWSAWSEAYGWSLHKNSAGLSSSWNGSTFGGVVGVQKTVKSLTLGIVGATGHSSATLSNPGSSLAVDSFHGGSYANVDLGVVFFNAGFLAGSADQSVKRDVSLAGLGGTARSKFQSSEYSAHAGGGLNFSDVRGFTIVPSLSLVSSGVVQDGLSESGAGPLSVSTQRKTLHTWQTRMGTEVSRKFKVAGNGLGLSSSVNWVHDFNSKPLGTMTQFTEASSAVGAYQSLGSRIGADAIEIGVGAMLDVSERTSVRVNGNWQIRDGSNQPGASVGVNVRF